MANYIKKILFLSIISLCFIGSSDASYYGAKDVMLEISRGNVSGITHVNKFGRNSDIDTATDPEDVWDAGGLWVPPTAARLHNIASSSANDTGTSLSTGTADTGSNTTTLYDASADFVTDTVAVGDTVLNTTNFDHATVITVDDLNTLTLHESYHSTDPGKTSVGLNAGDTYIVVTPASTGASVNHVAGLGSTMAHQEEFVILNGANNVATANTYWRIFRMHTDGAADRTATNVGNILATAQTDATVTAQINAGNGQTGMAVYTVPAGKTAYMTQMYADLVRGKSAVASLTLRETPMADVDGAGSRVKHFLGLDSSGSSHYLHTFRPYKKFLAQTDIWVRVDEVTANDMDISAGFDLILVDD